MKLENWENVLFSWMNSWGFTQEPVNDIGKLLDHQFYASLFKELGRDSSAFNTKGTTLHESIASFLREEYILFEINEYESWSEEDVLLISSLVLLSASLKSHNLRTPLFNLPSSTQLSIQAFFQRLISKLPQEITRDVLLEAIADTPSDDENDADLTGSPVLQFIPRFQESPEFKRYESSKMKSLQSKLDLVEWEKQHLLEEIEYLKKDLENLKKKYENKEHVVIKLETELQSREKEEEVETEGIIQKSKRDENRLKKQIEELEKSMEATRTDLYRAMTQNSNLESLLERSVEREDDAVRKCMELESKVEMMSVHIDDLESLVSNLKHTNKEQSELLIEKLHNKSLNASVCSFEYESESLATVVEMKYLEVEAKLSNLNADYKECLEEKGELIKTVENLQKKLTQLESENKEELQVLKSKLGEFDDLVEELKEENELLLASLEKEKYENEQFQKDLENIKASEVSVDSDYRSLSDSNVQRDLTERSQEKFIYEIDHLNSLLDGKQCVLDETKGLVNKLKREIANRDHDLTSLMEELSLTKSKSARKENQICELNKEIIDRMSEIENLKEEISKLKSENLLLKSNIRTTELEVENLRGDLRVKDTTVMALEQNINVYDHEKAILERKINFLKGDADKVDILKAEIYGLKKEISRLRDDIHSKKKENEKLNLEIEEKVDFENSEKLEELETKMRAEYKKKMLKDKSHIEQLSAELWETSDRYLLASQENKALRNQLQRTRAALEVLTNSRSFLPSEQRSNPCLWLDEEGYDERMTFTREVWARRSSLNLNKGKNDDDELFNDECLEDLKAGVCRLPDTLPPLPCRASYPVFRSTPDSSLGQNDRQSLLPEKPKKIKNSINYSRPGPPTPVKNRLSLQGLDKIEKVVKETEKIVFTRETAQGTKRLSRFFKTNQKTTKVVPSETQVSPRVKRKSFFQRKFGSNRENIPPN